MRCVRVTLLALLLFSGTLLLPPNVPPIIAQGKSEVAEDEREAEAERLMKEGLPLWQEGTAESLRSAIAKFEAAARLYGEIGNADGEATALLAVGFIQNGLGERQTALAYYDRAIELFRTAGNRAGEAQVLNNAGTIYVDLGERQKALDFFERALSLRQEIGDRAGEALVLNSMGGVYLPLGETQKALDFFERAASLYGAEGDRRGEAQNLNNVGSIYDDLGETQKALEFFERALILRREAGDRRGEAITLNNMGSVYDDLGEKQKALEFYELALTLRRETGDRGGEAQTLNNMGNVYSELGDKQKALEFYELALPLLQAAGDRRTEAAILNNIGEIRSSLGENREALEFYERALSSIVAVGDRRNEATVLTNLGNLYAALGEQQKALEVLERALPLRRAVEDRGGEAQTLVGIGSVYGNLGEKEKALEVYEQALVLHQAAGDRGGEATALNNIGRTYDDLEEKQKALDALERALRLYRIMGDRDGEATALSNIGNVYGALGAKQKALEFYERALPLLRAADDRGDEAIALNNIGATYNALGEKQKALEFYERALPALQAVGDRRVEAVTLNNMGAVYRDLGENQRALELYERALSLSRAVGDRRNEATVVNNIGALYDSLGEAQKALEFYERALVLTRAVGDRANEATTLWSVAVLQRDRGELQTALATIERSLELLEGLRENVADPDLKTSFFATRQREYEFYIDLLMALHQQNPDAGYDARALHATERSRARTLLELLAESHVNIREGISPELLQQEDDLRQQLDILETQQLQLLSRGNPDGGELQRIAADIDASIDAQQQLATKIRSNSPAYADIEYPQPLQLQDIQRHVLDEETLLLQYALGEERSFLWVVTTESIAVYPLPPRADIAAAAIAFRDTLTHSLKRRLPNLSHEAAARLGEMVLGPARDALSDKRLLVVADGPLHYVPFAALDISNGEEGYVPLIRDREVVTAPSATVLATLRKQARGRKPAPKAVAVLADPVFGGNDDFRVAGEAENESAIGDWEIEANGRDFGIGIPPQRLPGTRREAEVILALIPDAEEFAAFGFDADLETATSPALQDYRIVHFATHGFANSQNPARSGLIFSLANENLEPVNGFLRLNDIFNLNLPAELVVLSACQTGLGENVRGEGLVGLTRGFMYAGAPRLIVSLWSVSDDGTAELMQRFYRNHLEAGLTPAAALRKAQLELLEDAQFSHPFFWSAFAFQGEWLQSENFGL